MVACRRGRSAACGNVIYQWQDFRLKVIGGPKDQKTNGHQGVRAAKPAAVVSQLRFSAGV